MLVPSEASPDIAALLILAERDSARALASLQEIDQRWDAADPQRSAWMVYARGWVGLRRMDVAGAQALLAQAQAAFEDLGLARLVLHCRRALLIAGMLAGADKSQQRLWDALVNAYIADNALLEAARTRIQQAAHLNALGRHVDARTLLGESAALLYRLGSLDDLARLCRVTAIAASYLDDGDYALAQLDAAISYFTSLEYPLDVAKCIFERGEFFERQEQYQAALSELEHAYEQFLQLHDLLQAAVCEKTLGLVQSRLGRFDQAIALTVAAQRRFRVFGRRDHVAGCDLNLGNIAYYSGRFDLAMASYRRAQHVFDALGIQHDAMIARRNQAMVLRAQGQAALALEHLLVLEQTIIEQGNMLELANIYQAQAEALTDLGEYTAALDRLNRAQTTFVGVNKRSISAQCMLEQGWILIAQGQFDAAVECFIAAQPALTQRPIHLWRVFYGQGYCAHQRGDDSTALGHYVRASTLIADLRTTLYSEHTSSGLFQQAHTFFCDAIRLAVARQDLATVLTFVEQQHALLLQQTPPINSSLHVPHDLELPYDHLRAALRKLVAQDAAPAYLDEVLNQYLDLLLRIRHHVVRTERSPAAMINLDQLRARLMTTYPAGWLALVYIECDAQLLIVTLEQHTVTLDVTPLDTTLRTLLADACAPKLRRFTYLDLARRYDSSRPAWEHLRMLTDRLLPRAVRTRLRATDRLLIAPSGLLHGLPWAGLRLEDGWLCERTTLHLIPTLGLWERLSTRTTAGDEALLIGCSSFGDRAEPLPEVANELAIVAARYPGAVMQLHDSAATRRAVQALNAEQQLTRFALIHVASHARLVAARGLLSHIKLWDDDLFYDEIVGSRLSGAIVVLSTCEGDQGEVLPGEEVLSLGRAFLAAGARDVIASLWPIDDRLTRSFVCALYDGLAAGMDTPMAVASAQRLMLLQASADQAEDLSSPLVWAGFHILGAGTYLAPPNSRAS